MKLWGGSVITVNGGGTTAAGIGANTFTATQTVNSSGVSGSRLIFSLNGVNSVPAANDEIYASASLSNSSLALVEAVRITARLTTVTAGAETSRLIFSVRNAGSFAEELGLTNTALFPVANGGLALGAATLGYSNLFFAANAIINFNNGNYTITHAAGSLTTNGSFVGVGIYSTTFFRPGLTTVGALPAAATAGVGAMMMVSDATLTTAGGIGVAVTGGGANTVQVTSNGSVWYISG